ncbi:unnamed protein product [Ceutorhynchus assimilis]|uniref:PH domain-containing protein n=1 Tax=Ceutorhynchus assimilis TaxID=467358 RepID=A0A9N9MLQ5_9CUCU|nr:unnamed protein product [Ceutorhynchus assimilis]
MVDANDSVPVLINGAKEECLMVPKHPKNSDVGNKEFWVRPKVLIDRDHVDSLKKGENALLIGIKNPDSFYFQGVSESINLKITDYAYGFLDPKRKALNISSESVRSAYEVTENSHAKYTSLIDDAVSEYFSIASSSISPAEMCESYSSYFSLDSSTSVTESDYSITSGSYSIPTESDSDHNEMPDISNSVKTRIDKLTTFVPLAAQSTPIKRKTDISYPKTLEFRPMKQKTFSGKQSNGFEKYKHSYTNLMQKLRKSKFSVEEQRYSQVIAELMEKFKLEKAKRDKMNSSADSGLDSETNKTVEKDQGFYKQFVAEVTTNRVHVNCQGASTNKQTNTSLNEDSSNFDESKFLHNAIGDEIQRTEASENCQYPQAMCTITNIRKRKTRRSIKGLLKLSCTSSPISDNSVTVNSQDVSIRPELIEEPFSHVSFEDITNLGIEIYTEEGQKQIKKHIYINKHIIGQTEKMLKYGLKTPRFIGSLAHMEAERILLVSKTRTQVLINQLDRIPEPINEAVARVTMEKLKFKLNLPQENRNKIKYFVCILQHKTTVYSTKFATANSQGLIDLGGFFIFQNISNTFNIKIQLYSITLPKNSKGCMLLPFSRRACKVPLMELVGTLPVNILNINNERFTFNNSEHKLLVSIEASVVWPEPLRGFMTVGTGKIDQYPTWDKRWCVMEKAILSYYNYPSDESCNSPLGTVDLKLCKSVDGDTVKYMEQKTLRLFIEKENNLERVFLSPDTDYDLWSKHLDIVLKLNNQWSSLEN